MTDVRGTRCDICYNITLFEYCLGCHIRKVICSECSKQFSSYKKYQKHLKEHSSGNTFFECYLELRKKKTSHRVFVCPHCTFVFTSISDLITHERTVHGVGKQYICSHCGRRYCTRFSIRRHMRTHFIEPSMSCSVCDKQFYSSYDLKEHEKIHKSNVGCVCEYCGKSLKTLKSKNRHIAQHSAEKFYTCDDCGKSFLFHFTLKRHLRIHNESKMTFECDYCGRRYNWKTDLIRHIRSKHFEIRPYTCKFANCKKQFSRQCYLLEHQTSHGQAKMHMCFCGKTFRYMSNLTRHRKTHKNLKYQAK